MLDRLRLVAEEYDDLERQLSDPEVIADADKLRVASKRYNELMPVIEAFRRYEGRLDDAEAAREMLLDAEGDEKGLLQNEIDEATAETASLEAELRELMLPKDPHDGKKVLVEIRGAEGGEEANLFARDLMEMYVSYAARHGWKVTTLSSSPSEMGGVNDVTLEFAGDTAWRGFPSPRARAGSTRVPPPSRCSRKPTRST